MKRIFLVVVSLMMMVTLLVGSTSADGMIGNLDENDQVQGTAELNVRTLTNRYFAQRKAYLQGVSETIPDAVEPIVADEAVHKEWFVDSGANLVDSTIVIDSVAIGDYINNVEVIETATFVIDGITVQESIIHKISVYLKNSGDLIVGSDGYAEDSTGFESASYVDVNEGVVAEIASVGSPICIAAVAKNEVGTGVAADGSTKYGRWYAGLVGDPGYATAAWCTSFVAWCANKASVSIGVIPFTAYAPTMAGFYNNLGRYHRSASGGGNYTPQRGDIIFIGVNDNDSLLSPGHVGIVVTVYNGKVYYVEGNAQYYQNGVLVRRVWYTEKSLTATDILAYGNPDYPANTHTLLEWNYDEFYHWANCDICNMQVVERHSIDPANGYCRVCGH